MFARLAGDDQLRTPYGEAYTVSDQPLLGAKRPSEGAVKKWRQTQLSDTVAGIVPARYPPRSIKRGQQEGNEGCLQLDPKARRLQLPLELVRTVTAKVPRVAVLAAPKEHMLWDRDDRAASRSKRPVDLRDDSLIVLDVLKYVKRTDNIEFLFVRDAARIHLEERRGTAATLRNTEPGDGYLTAIERQLRELATDSLQHEPGTATNLEQRPRIGAVPVQRLHDKLVTAPKPKALLLQFCQQLELFGPETAAAGNGERRRMRQVSIHCRRPIPAVRTLPLRVMESRRAFGTDLHPWLATVMPATINTSPIVVGSLIVSPNRRPPPPTTNTKVNATNG